MKIATTLLMAFAILFSFNMLRHSFGDGAQAGVPLEHGFLCDNVTRRTQR